MTLPSYKNIILYSVFAISMGMLSYFFLDRQIAEWTFYHTREHSWHLLWQYATDLEPLYFALSPWFVLFLIFKIINEHKIYEWEKVFFLMIVSMWLTLMLNEQLRFIFGRYWPATWFHNNLSYIQNSVYGFTWFKSQHEYRSFPSGHTSLMFGFMMTLWWQTDKVKIKLFAIINCLLVALGLILMCYHFMSDVIIGALVGTLSAYLILCGFQHCNVSFNNK